MFWIIVRHFASSCSKDVLERPTALGAGPKKTNLDVVRTLCEVLDDVHPRASGNYEDLIEFVQDRPGHDRRYAVSPVKLEQEMGWRPQATFDVGIRETVRWFLAHEAWARRARKGGSEHWLRPQNAASDHASSYAVVAKEAH